MCSSLLLIVSFYSLPSSRPYIFRQPSAKASLELHGKELEPDLPLSGYISNPERKKDRTDADANAREIDIAGFSRFASKEDREKLVKSVSSDYFNVL